MPSEEDSVTIAFDLMLSELGAEIEELNARGAQLFQRSEYQAAKPLIEMGESLRSFRSRAESMRAEWVEKFSDAFAERPMPKALHEVSRAISSGSKSPKTKLLVKFADGTAISTNKASQTFAEVFKRLGFERVASLQKYVNGEDLISRKHSDRYNDTYIGGYYIRTHSSTNSKRLLLEEIARDLGERISVQII